MPVALDKIRRPRTAPDCGGQLDEDINSMCRLREATKYFTSKPTNMEVPDRPVSFVPFKAGDVITLGTMKLRVMEDGSNTGKLHLSHIQQPISPAN